MALNTATKAVLVDSGACYPVMHLLSLGSAALTSINVGKPMVFLLPHPFFFYVFFVIRHLPDVVFRFFFPLLFCVRLAYEFCGLHSEGCLSAIRSLPLLCDANQLF
jgi:hypothetical protein